MKNGEETFALSLKLWYSYTHRKFQAGSVLGSITPDTIAHGASGMQHGAQLAHPEITQHHLG